MLLGLNCLFYYPNQKIYYTPDRFGLRYDDVRFPARDGTDLHGWYLYAEGKPRGTIIHFHGNAANISNHLPLVYWLPAEGYNVLMFDYRGFGKSAGKPTRKGTVADGHGAVDYVQSRPDNQSLPLLAYGQSIGGAIATVVVAERKEVAGLIIETAFDDYRKIASDHLSRKIGLRWLANLVVAATISNDNQPIESIANIAPRPVFSIIAAADQICFPQRGQALHAAAAEPKTEWLVPDAQHLAIELAAGDELRKRILAFFDSISLPKNDAASD